jgi:hypothetical protein
MSLRQTLRMGALFAGMAMMPCPVFACAACFGQSDSAMAAGMNWGILSLLGMIGMVLGGVAAFFVFLARKAAAAAATEGLTGTVGRSEVSWTPHSKEADVVDGQTLAYRGSLKHSPALAHPPHRCPPPQRPVGVSAPRKRA